MNKSFDGNCDNFFCFFEMLSFWELTFDWLSIEEVTFPNYEEIFRNNIPHRYIKSENVNFRDWKQLVLNNSNSVLPQEDTYRYFEIVFSINVNDAGSMLKNECIAVFSWYPYNEKENNTDIAVFLKMRGEPFYIYPWGKEYPDFYLSKECVEHNRKLLRESMMKLESKGFEIESFGFEWGSHPRWKIDKYGFID
jgi:hypothetical protein